jgi:diacylglycerol kinase family enzyme
MRISVGNEGAMAKPTILAAFANAPAYGGGMKIAPHAQLDDGKLDVCIVRGMDPFKLFCLFPTVYLGGHLGFREVEYSQTESARIETEYPLEIYADGEYVCRTPVEFSVARNGLKVIVPS